MNKKIKVIELLNKIANGEKVPKKISYQDKIFEKSEDNDYTTNDGIPLVHLINYNLSNLNDETEIIEEQQDIDCWEEIANTFRKYGETLAEKIAKIGRQIDKNKQDKESNK